MQTQLDQPRTEAGTTGARRILVVIGHPLADTLNHALANVYVAEARAGGADVRVHDLARVRFPRTDTIEQLRAWNGDTSPLDRVVRGLVDDLLWSEHLVILFPQWWGTFPAALTEYLDRVFLSGVAFRYKKGQLPNRMLTGRTARILMTADGPGWWNRLAYRNAAETALSRATLGYCGVRVRGITRFMKVRFSTPEQRAGWLRTAGALGAKDAAAGANGRVASRAR